MKFDIDTANKVFGEAEITYTNLSECIDKYKVSLDRTVDAEKVEDVTEKLELVTKQFELIAVAIKTIERQNHQKWETLASDSAKTSQKNKKTSVSYTRNSRSSKLFNYEGLSPKQKVIVA